MIPKPCAARREQDEMVCRDCGRRYDVAEWSGCPVEAILRTTQANRAAREATRDSHGRLPFVSGLPDR